MNKYRTRIVYTSFVADLLMEWGEEFLHLRQDLKYPDKNVFVFRNSESFDESLEAAIKIQVESYNN